MILELINLLYCKLNYNKFDFAEIGIFIMKKILLFAGLLFGTFGWQDINLSQPSQPGNQAWSDTHIGQGQPPPSQIKGYTSNQPSQPSFNIYIPPSKPALYSTNQVNGWNNQVDGKYNIISGTSNQVYGQVNYLRGSSNDVAGLANQVQGSKNLVYGYDNTISGKHNVVIG